MHIGGVNHININCSDLEKSREFYEMLGFEVWFPLAYDSDPVGNDALERAMNIPEGAPVSGYYMKYPNIGPYDTFLDLLCWPKTEGDDFDPGQPYDHARRLGHYRVCLWSKDFDADLKFLQEKGVKFVGEPSNQMTKAGLSQVCAFYDPDGTVIEMTNDWARPKEAGSKPKGMFDGGETL